MNGALAIVALVALATLATFLLERGGRQGYGWVTGSEFVILGAILGPLGLDLLSRDLLSDAELPLMLAAAWLGLRFGLRLRPSALRPLSWRVLLASQLEPLVTLVVLRELIDLTSWLSGVSIPSLAAWALAAAGAATTKSAVAWARAQHGAAGPLCDALGAVATLDDLVTIGATGLFFALSMPRATLLPPHAWAPIAATLILAAGLGLLVLLLTGWGTFRADLSWVALIGICTLGTGLASQLGVSAMAVTCGAGVVIGLFSPHADAFDEITRATERPAVQVLLLLGGAWIPGALEVLAVGVAFGLLRLFAKLVGGAAVAPFATVAKRTPWLGMGLIGAGGVAYAAAFSIALSFSPEIGGLVMAGAAGMAVVGDLVGSPALKALLRLTGELPPPPSSASGEKAAA